MKKTLNIGGRILDLSEPKIMGIINLTPDSFYQESRSLNNYKRKIDKMITEGADILDLGAYSTRPGAIEISVQEEIDRLLPALEYLNTNYSGFPVSVDTFRSKVALSALKLNSFIINDISGGTLDSKMWDVVANAQVPYILMHMRGTPKTMQESSNTAYGNVILDVFNTLQGKVEQLKEKGLKDIVIDPGIGFAKDSHGNFELTKNLSFFKTLDYPILVGLSRKSFIYKTLGVNAKTSLNGTTALHSVCLLNGAKILRVHDVKEAIEVKRLIKMLEFTNS